METTSTGKRKKTAVKDWIVVLGIPLVILLTWVAGGYFNVSGDLALAHESIQAKDLNLDRVNSHKWNISDSLDNHIGCAYLGKGSGYGGTMLILTFTDTSSVIIDIDIISHSETYTYFKKLQEKSFFAKVIGQHPKTLANANDIDAVSGATLSSLGIIEGVIDGYSKGEGVSFNRKTSITFGLKEVAVILLLAFGLIIPKVKRPKLKVRLLWLSQVGDLATLGIWLNSAITLTQLNALTQGYLPALAGGLFIVIIIIGSLLIPLVSGKNIYCSSVCPFGAAQRVLGLLGYPRTFRPSYFKWLKRIQWSAALIAISVAAYARNPTISDYTIFGNFFRLNGSSIAIGAVVLVIILSLFINRPWCHFACPIDGVFAYIKFLNRKIVKPFTTKISNNEKS